MQFTYIDDQKWAFLIIILVFCLLLSVIVVAEAATPYEMVCEPETCENIDISVTPIILEGDPLKPLVNIVENVEPEQVEETEENVETEPVVIDPPEETKPTKVETSTVTEAIEEESPKPTEVSETIETSETTETTNPPETEPAKPSEPVSEPPEAPESDEPVSDVSENDVELLAIAIYAEAGGDACCDDCRRRVADVVLNRVADNRFPDSIHDVLTQPGQYAAFGNGVKWPTRASNPGEKRAVERAYRIAREVLSGQHSELYGRGYIWQAQFIQGSDNVYCCGHYYGR